MKKLFVLIIVIAGIAGLVFAPLWRVDTLNPQNLRWYHYIDLQNPANDAAALHIANECMYDHVTVLKPDGVYCYNASTSTQYVSIFDMILGSH